jgi:hypothetical protein
MAPDRDRQFRMNLSDGELQMLKELAEKQGLTASDYLRMLIRNEHGQQVGLRFTLANLPEPDRVKQLVKIGSGRLKRSIPKPKRK